MFYPLYTVCCIVYTVVTNFCIIYIFSDCPNCPVKSFQRYLDKFNPACSLLFQRPQQYWIESEKTWYRNSPFGHNTLGSMMRDVSQSAKLSIMYTIVERLRDIKHHDCSNCHKSMKFCVLIVFYC